MRNFLGTYWKVIVALIILVLLAVFTMSPGAASPPLAARLRAHVQAIVGTQADETARLGEAAHHIETTLAAAGYAVRRQAWSGGGRVERGIEASVANLAPGTAPQRTFIIGANGGNGSGAAAVLELARLLRHVRPSPGTELKFVFFVGGDASVPAAATPQPADRWMERRQLEDPASRYPDTGNFIAFVGTPAASRQVQEALSAFRAVSDFPAEGLAAPAFVQGVTVSRHANCTHCGERTLTISDGAFLGYPYYHTGDDGDELDYGAIARVVTGLARTIGVLAEGQRG
jgi:hypothetical protein